MKFARVTRRTPLSDLVQSAAKKQSTLPPAKTPPSKPVEQHDFSKVNVTDCTPRDMKKVTSGPLVGGLTMDTYFPGLAGTDEYDDPANAGEFDTKSWAGAKIQLLGVVPPACDPAQFSIYQEMYIAKESINDVTTPNEGISFDDIANSGQDSTRPPFRQEFLGGIGGAPFGYIVSWADPVGVKYVDKSITSRERHVMAESAIEGPQGRKAVKWSHKIKTAYDRVLENKLK